MALCHGVWVSLWLLLDVRKGDDTSGFSSVRFIDLECCISNIQEVFMWVLGPINGMTSSLNSLDQYNVLHMSSAQAICLNDCKLRRTRVDS